MKKTFLSGTFLSGLVVATLIAAVYSCNKFEPSAQTKQSTENFVAYEKSETTMGGIHNDVMAAVYTNLMSNVDESSSYILNDARATIKSELLSNSSISSADYDVFISDIGFDLALNSSVDFNQFLESKKDDAIAVIASEIDEELAEDLDNYSNSSVTLNQTDFEIASTDLIDKYRNTDHEDVVSAIVSIGTSSYSYWTQNGKNWANPNDPSPAVHPVVKADINGAIVGAGWGATAGAFAGGVGAIPGALLGGCISSSFGSAVSGICLYMGW